MAGYPFNRMAANVAKMEGYLPTSLRSWGYSMVFNRMVKLAGTAGINVEEMSRTTAVVSLKNRTKVQNHIGGLHACAMTLVGESATGIVVGMNVPDNAIPLCKSIKVNFVKRCEGDIRAVATLTEQQLKAIHTEPKGEVLVDLKVTDESGKSPIVAEMVWAWVPKDRKPKTKAADKPSGEGAVGGTGGTAKGS